MRVLESKTVRRQLVLAGLLGTLVACGGDKKDDDGDDPLNCTEGDACLGKATVTAGTAGVVTVDFSKADAGAQFVVMPFVAGDTATVPGGGADKFTFKVEASTTGEGATLTRLEPRGAHLRRDLLTPEEFDHGKRTLLNRYRPELGDNQGEWFWNLARRLDAHIAASDAELGRALTESATGPVESAYRRGHSRKASTAEGLRLTTAVGDCPTTDVVMPDVEDPGGTSDTQPVAAGNAVAADDYCIVYLADPVTESSKDAIAATVGTVVSRFKTLYGTALDTGTATYAFKPVVVVVDFKDADVWPQSQAWQIAGAFLGKFSADAKMPMIYMPADLGAVGGASAGGSAETNKVIWHGVIAHEMQHAIINFLRVQKAGKADEVASIDEGLAHMMENVFGHGPETFTGFAKAYLDVWALTQPTFIDATESGNVARGGAQTLLYWMASQKGGVNFDAGVVKDGGGLDFLVGVAGNSAKSGPANLLDKFGGDAIDMVGNYLAALVVDGTTLKGVAAEHKCQEPVSIKNLLNTTGKMYGMHFNGFGELPAIADYTGTVMKSGESTAEIQHYATAPLLYTAGETNSAFKLTVSDVNQKNVGVTVVRIK